MLSMMNGCPRWSFLTVPLLAALGCSDPVPRPAQGNMTLSIGDPTGAKCPASAKTYQVGNPTAPSITAVPNEDGDRLIDGEKGASIKCSVTGSGPYNFSATIKALSSESDKVTLTVTNGIINADKATGSATVAVNTPQLSGNSFVSEPGACVVSVVNQNVKAGSLWASVSCAKVTLASTGQSCAVGMTTNFIVENCEGT